MSIPQIIAALGGTSIFGILVVVAIVAVARGNRHDRDSSDTVDRGLGHLDDRLDMLRNELRDRDATSDARLARIEQIVEVLSVEVERVGEAQRFTSRLLAERVEHEKT